MGLFSFIKNAGSKLFKTYKDSGSKATSTGAPVDIKQKQLDALNKTVKDQVL